MTVIRSKEEFKTIIRNYRHEGINPYVVKAHDTFLSGWGMAEGKKHYQVVVCLDLEQAKSVKASMLTDTALKRVVIMPAVNFYYNKAWTESVSVRGTWALAGVKNF